MIGPTATLSGTGTSAAVLRRATAQGLTRWDAAAVVTPALASRWIVLDDGLTLIFRLDEARWADGTPVRATAVAERLKALLARPGTSPVVRAAAAAVEEVNAVTPAVVELRLRAQRPDLLVLLAQPEFAMLRDGGGAGPLRPRPQAAGWRPLSWPEQSDQPVIRLRGETAARALAKFANGEVGLVLGGTAADAPLLAESGAEGVVVDPTNGLFALAVRRREGLLATAEGREALSLAIDRPALLRTFGLRSWSALEPDPARTLDELLALARERVVAVGSPVRLTLAHPSGLGGRLLVAVLTRQLAQAGIALTTAPAASADLILIDSVAASAEPASTLELIGCGRVVPCGPALTHALARMADQPTPAGWRFWSGQAMAAARADRPVIPLARPLRWSLAAPGLTLIPNPRAIHPLTSLIAPASPSAP